jgi:[ribosomal protein S5]-alanine N-acetyltransferase
VISEAAFAALNAAPCELSSAHYRLRPLRDDDAADLFAHFGDPEVTAFLDIRPFETKSDAFEMIDWAKGIRARGTGVRWRVSDGGDGFVGTCGYQLLTHGRGRRGEIGFDLARGWQGRGVMAEVLPVVLAFGFEALGLRRVEAMVTPGNDRSRRLLERQGFVREGVLRDYAFWNGRFWDQILYARLASDAPAD